MGFRPATGLGERCQLGDLSQVLTKNGGLCEWCKSEHITSRENATNKSVTLYLARLAMVKGLVPHE